MNLDRASFVPAEELSFDVDLILNRLSDTPEIIILEHDKPQFAIMSLDRYEAYGQSVPNNKPSAPQDGIKIGRMVQESMRKLFYNGCLPESEIENLTSPEYSKRVFALNFPVLKKYDPTRPFDEQKRDAKGYNRYYQVPLTAKNAQYLLCSQWIEPLHRERFEAWLAQWEFKYPFKLGG